MKSWNKNYRDIGDTTECCEQRLLGVSYVRNVTKETERGSSRFLTSHKYLWEKQYNISW